jgi:hypothetical protein
VCYIGLEIHANVLCNPTLWHFGYWCVFILSASYPPTTDSVKPEGLDHFSVRTLKYTYRYGIAKVILVHFRTVGPKHVACCWHNIVTQ